MDDIGALRLDQALAWIRLLGATLHQQRERLTHLDAAIGDGDHGINMDRGFAAVTQKLKGASPADLGALFTLVGSTLVSTVGGASGPLYGTAFLRLGGALTGQQTAGAVELASALAAAYGGIATRGKSSRGEKTMLDAFGPAVDAFQHAVRDGQPLPAIAAAAAQAAEDGAEATIPIQAARGRASYLGEGSIGHQDPGAASTALFFRTLADSLRARPATD